jgi:uridylate kinase
MLFDKKIQETVVLSVGGSLVVPDGGIDTEFLKGLNDFVRKHVKKGRRFFIVVGGGTTARQYRDAGKKTIGEVTNEDLDWLGIHATRVNAQLLRTIFKDIAHPKIIKDYDKKENYKEPVVIGSGWKPGWSTDYDATILARDYKASVIINLSNIDYVYDKDPKKFKDAKPIKKTTWDYFETLVGNKWVPGSNAPFDPIASQLAKQIGVTVIVANGKKFKNLANILNGESFIGTVITPFKIDSSYYDREYFEGKKGEYRLGYSESFMGNLLQNAANLYRAIWIKFVLNPKSCLDIGCGTGKLVYYLRKLGIEAYGIEISHYALESARKEIKPYLQFGDITKIPHEDNSFDAVVTFDVLEHLERSRLRKSVEESIRISRKWIVHKVFTKENHWIHFSHSRDFSHMSVLSIPYWLNMFKYIENVTVVRKLYFRFPSFVETLFLLRKKN